MGIAEGADETFDSVGVNEGADKMVDSKMKWEAIPGTEMDSNKEAMQNYNTPAVLPAELLDEDLSPVEQVNLTVPITDDPSLPVLTFRCWVLGLLSCVVLGFVNQFFSYRTEPLNVTSLTAQILAMPLGRFMAATLPTRVFFPGSRFAFTMNPGPFNIKEHVLITIFANTGYQVPYALGIVDIVKVFYKKRMTFEAAFLITITSQMIGYGWAGMFRSFLVKPGVMWWPSNLVQVALFRTLHVPDRRPKSGFTRLQFFQMGMTCSFAWYLLPGYIFPMLSSLSWVCWAFPNSILAHQLGSGLNGLGIGAIGVDWSVVSSAFLGSPLATPWFAIANVAVGYFIVMYVITPIAYWSNIYNAKTFPIFSSGLFQGSGESYPVDTIITENFSLDLDQYKLVGPVHLSTFFAFTYGVGFASLSATITHVALFYGKDIWRISTQVVKSTEEDIHTRLMRAYKEVPMWWFHLLFVLMLTVTIATFEVFKSQLQLPWWGILMACALSFVFTLPTGIIAATTNQGIGLNVITEYLIGYVYPGRPVANVTFKTYGYISMVQAQSFLSDFKLGHYMKVPPISMFIVQVVGTMLGALVSLGTTWWMLTSIKDICFPVDYLDSPWTCPGDHVFYDASVIWGLVGPQRIFGNLGIYEQVNWWFGVGLVLPIPVWIATKIWPEVGFFRAINMPILIGATGVLPPATAVNYTMWIIVGFIFNFVIYRYRKAWWSRYNYVLSASLDAGVAFMGVAIYFLLQYENSNFMLWWGTNRGDSNDNCPLANCPTQPGLGQLQTYPNCPAT